MALSDEQPVRELSDRIMRQSLKHPDNLRTFLEQVVPELAGGFDCSRARLLDREFPLDDWRHREADLPFEIPFRVGDKETQALVVVLIEHQSRTDPLMPLRMLYFAVVYWERQWHAWEQTPPPRAPLRLRPVLPLVLHTGPRPWGSGRRLVDLLGEPVAFHAFAPSWEPLFWNVSERSPEELLQSGLAWLETLAVVRAADAGPDAFREVFIQAMRQLQDLFARDKVRWYDLMRIVTAWVAWRRPTDEQQKLWAAMEANDADLARRQEVLEMLSKWGPTIADLALAEGEAKGEARGEARGKMEGIRATLLRLGRRRFGEPTEATQSMLQAVTDVQRLEQLAERLLEVTSWAELLQPPA